MSIITKTFSVFILQILLLLSILFLLRGHNNTGGGFIGALIASTGIGFYILAHKKPPKFINKRNYLLISLGILSLLISMFIALFYGKSLFTGVWVTGNFLGQHIKIGTPLLFDIGIYLSILGGLLSIMTALEEDKDA